jgi:oxygen-dependent protoporphyrinogen oxidase
MKIAIIGGGISGLSCAYYLRQTGHEPVVFDPHPGGSIGTVTLEGCILETGPESWLASKPWAEQLIQELGLGDQVVGSNDAARRTYVLRHGHFVTLPEGLQMVAPTRVWPIIESRLFTWHTKLRMGMEIFRSPRALPDRSVSEFVADHFGEEAVAYLAEPLLAGVYGGSPDQLSAPAVLPKFVEYEQRYGSVVVGTMRDKRPSAGQSIFKTMRRGMGTLIDALLERACVAPERVESLAPAESGWMVFAGGEWLGFDHVVLACGANHAAPLVAPVDERLAELLASVPYSSSAIWTFGFRREDVPHPLDAFGFLVPRAERQAIMACTWLGTKWAERVPPDKAVFRCFSTDADVSRDAMLADLGRLMGISAAPIFEIAHRWPDSMPQYSVGHIPRVVEMDARAATIPGFSLIGNAFHGVGIPDCVRLAKEAAARIGAAA